MAKKNETERLMKLTSIEREYWQQGVYPGGMDEVGRGPLAGPVVTACVVMPDEPLVQYVNDSKKLSQGRREKLYPQIIETSCSYGIGWAWQDEIDNINILQATKLAFKRAYAAMEEKPDIVLIDAVRGLDIPAGQRSLIHGDELSYLIAAASILAKVERDRYMVEMDRQYPQYGFARNKGYGTAEHITALKKYGPCPIHRASFIGGIIGKADE